MLDTSYFLLFLLPDVAVFILVGLFVRVSLSLLVLVAVPLAEAVLVKVGLLLFVILLVTLVLGPSYSPLWPYCGWDSIQNNPAPKPGIIYSIIHGMVQQPATIPTTVGITSAGGSGAS